MVDIIGEKEQYLYEEKFKEEAKKYNVKVFVWGEDLIDRKLIVYADGLKELPEYGAIKHNLERCRIVQIDVNKNRNIRWAHALADMKSGNIYVSEQEINRTWRRIRKSVRLGIQKARQGGECPIEKPEDILVLDHLVKKNRIPQMAEDGVITYRARELTDEEKHLISRRQSLLDNPQILYFYEEGGRCFHDKDCDEIKNIPLEKFQASREMPHMEICPRCRRKIYFRTACYPNTKQISVCSMIFSNYNVKIEKIRHLVVDCGMKFHATSTDELLVVGKEDTWIIKGLSERKPTLWHNNYVRISDSERYITEGFHIQKTAVGSFLQLFDYINGYSFEKHLDDEKKRRLANIASESVKEIHEAVPCEEPPQWPEEAIPDENVAEPEPAAEDALNEDALNEDARNESARNEATRGFWLVRLWTRIRDFFLH